MKLDMLYFVVRVMSFILTAILSLYLRNILCLHENAATVVYHIFIMMCYTMPLMGAVLADNFIGRYRLVQVEVFITDFCNLLLKNYRALWYIIYTIANINILPKVKNFFKKNIFNLLVCQLRSKKNLKKLKEHCKIAASQKKLSNQSSCV